MVNMVGGVRKTRSEKTRLVLSKKTEGRHDYIIV